MLSPDARARKERIFSTAVRPKIGKKVTLDENSNSGPPIYIESLEELLAVAREYVTKVPNTPIAPDLMAMLRPELDAQQKQFELIMKQNLDLLTNMAQNGGGNGGGGGDGGGDNKGDGGGGRHC
jgi:hypothetical protein